MIPTASRESAGEPRLAAHSTCCAGACAPAGRPEGEPGHTVAARRHTPKASRAPAREDAPAQIAEPGALIGFAGQRVIEQTIREKLPEGFQRAEYLLEHGMVDMVTHRHELKETLGRVIGLLMSNRTKAPLAAE